MKTLIDAIVITSSILTIIIGAFSFLMTIISMVVVLVNGFSSIWILIFFVIIDIFCVFLFLKLSERR